MTYISRDTFARTELHRESITPGRALNLTTKVFEPQTCCNCGGLNGRGKLFRYSVERDGCTNRTSAIKGLFCSIDCMRIYHG